jgi:riboflavin kinase/FMN adenylyltransferase
MRVETGDPSAWPLEPGPTGVTVGVFDGVHLGHRKVLSQLVDGAKGRGLTPIALTFDPHPLEVLAPERAPRLLTSLEQRLELFAAIGIERTGVLAIGDVRALDGETFAETILQGRLAAALVVVGSDFRFGRSREGDTTTLRTAGKRLGFEVEVVMPVDDAQGHQISSTRIRALLAEGDVEAASGMLGRLYGLRGRVVIGELRGRRIGYPTANLEIGPNLQLPADGVYAARATVGDTVHQAVVNIGVRPTFGLGTRTVEAHLLSFEGDLYGRTVGLHFVARLREERRFDSVESLVSQIADDVDAARSRL